MRRCGYTLPCDVGQQAIKAKLHFPFREGNDLWLVYNESMNLDRDPADPMLLRTDNRTLLLKYTHTIAR